ncbi:MAG TPA: hypothetical protein PK109_01795 [Candidatus Paceibacterota bacterium]|jgi:hypothetical protein|nr:hypothetical protein [Candidatus Paceibacterota bacterium]
MTVEFDEAVPSGQTRPAPKPSFFTSLIIKTGIVKTPGGAQIVMGIIALALLALTLFQFKHVTTQAPLPTPEQIAL